MFQDTKGSTVQHVISIPGRSDDSRAVRTRGLLASALMALMHKKGFDEISVQEICARAGVGRSTFYAHFQDRDELLVRHMVVFARALGAELAWDDALGSHVFPVRRLFEHVRQMKPLLDSLARARKAEFIIKVLQNNIAEAFEQRVRTLRGDESAVPVIPAALLAQQLAGTLVTLMVWWMDHHYPLTTQEMEKQFHLLTAGIGR